MTPKRSLIDILETAIQAMAFPITIWKVTATVANTWQLNVDNLYHAVKGYIISIGGNNYTIVSVNDDTSPLQLTVTDPTGLLPAPTAQTSFNLYSPFFFHGMPRDSSAEMKQEQNAFNKYPMIWLMETFTETFYDDPEDANERDSQVKLYFLTDSQFETNQTNDLYEIYLLPMRRLLDSFIDMVNTQYSYFVQWNLKYNVTNYPKFGVYIRGKGVAENLFADNLTGCELDIVLKITKPNSSCNS
jgi:hypothetical protein